MFASTLFPEKINLQANSLIRKKWYIRNEAIHAIIHIVNFVKSVRSVK